ncbi:hypothetical protein [Dactylosporangium sp. NPDC000521]|uniref:hypothetical protein n=1 Tax=Dactylosporangium sp. NPDC000521 TaxID=3363975 RepID=UPI0036AAFFEC
MRGAALLITSAVQYGIPYNSKLRVTVHLLAHATTVTDPTERAAVIAAIVDYLNQPHDPGTIRPTRLEDWAAGRLMRIAFD